MFSYFGSKSKLLDLYPKPLYPKIIEPFCGSARYSCKYRKNRQVHLNDAYPVIADIWKWISKATPEQIRALPVLKKGETLKDFDISDDERNLLGFVVSMGAASPRFVLSGYSVIRREVERLKLRLIELKGYVDVWKITEGSYDNIPNEEATWYIDPPYQELGNGYVHHDIDYKHLAEWCKSRKGQVIVCEGGNANWLPFNVLKPIRKRINRKDAYNELIWYKCENKKNGFIF